MYKVFLSSTSRDLTTYREAVHRAIDQLDGFALVKMEDFGARDEAPRELCARLVGQSQVLVGLLGHYYGSCPPGEARSFTELEYATAVERGLPRVMFFAPDDFPIPASLREPDESFLRQQAFRAKVMAERVGASLASPEQLASAVTTALANWRQEHERRLAPTEPIQETPPPEPVPLGANPYRGLEAFRKQDAERFFGREVLVDKLWQQFLALHKAAADGNAPVRLLAILGASGSGKSSVAQAGLLAALDERPLPGRPVPPSVVLTPEARPLESLAVALARLATGEDSPASKAQEFEQVLRERESFDGLRYLAAHMLGVERAGLILLVDQFEEVFSLCDDAQEREAFIGNLLRAAGEPGQVSIVLTLRSDFLGEVNRHAELSRLIAAQNEVVPVMGEDDLRRAIEEPAKRAGRAIDEATVQLLLEQTRGREGALPLLEFVLTRIWEGFSQGVGAAGTIGDLGGVGGALAKQAQAVYDGLGQDDRAIARRAFLAMVRLGEGTRDTRRRAPLEEMVTEDRPEDRVLAVLRRFSEPGCRLISLSGAAATATAEVAHEALFDHWRLLQDWLDNSREDIRFQRRLSEAANHWDEMKRPDGSLWRPPELDLLRDFRSKAGSDMTPLELAFADASETQQRDEQKRERRQAEERRELLVRALRTQSLFLASLSQHETAKGDAATGMLLALEALPDNMASAERRPHVIEAEAALYAAVGSNRELAYLDGHTARVRSAAFCPNGKRVITASDDRTARLWDAASGKLLFTLRGHTAAVLSAAFNQDGTSVVTASYDSTARVWDVPSGEPIFTLEGHLAPVWSAAFSQDGTRIVTRSSDGIARLWDTASGKLMIILDGQRNTVRSAALSPDGTRVATAFSDNTARLWDTASGQLLVTLDGHKDLVSSAAFSPNGTRVVTTSKDYTARLWDATSGKLLVTLDGHTDEVWSAAFGPNGTRVVTASRDNTARLWDAVSGKLLLTLKGHTARVRSAAFNPDGTGVVTASDDFTARSWDAASGRLLFALHGHTAGVGSAAFSLPDGTQIVTASGDSTARLWDAVSSMPLVVLQGHSDWVRSTAFNPDGTGVVTASDDLTARLWDAASGRPLLALNGHTAGVRSAAFSLDGTRVVTASDDGTARLWDAASGKPLVTLQGHAAAVRSAAFSPDGARVVTASRDNTARLWDAVSGRPLVTLRGHTAPVRSVAYSLDGTRVATASDDGTATLWDAILGAPLAYLEGHTDWVKSAAFSRDGTRVVTASDDGTARLWDAASGKPLMTLHSHTDSVLSAAFSHDDTRVATASDDGSARLWDAATGKTLVTLNGPGPALSATFSYDGARIITTGSDDGTARMWKGFPTTQALIDHARSIVPRELTPKQRKQFFLE